MRSVFCLPQKGGQPADGSTSLVQFCRGNKTVLVGHNTSSPSRPKDIILLTPTPSNESLASSVQGVQEAALLGLAQALERNPCLLPRLMGSEASKQTDSDARTSTLTSSSLASLAVQAAASNRSSQLRISGGRLLSALVRAASLPGSLSCGTDRFLKELLDAVSCMVDSAVAAAAAALGESATDTSSGLLSQLTLGG